MEVHHHPHIDPDNYREKGFKEYLLEFVMIFLAVTLGFFAEQIREGFAQRSEEREYVKSFYEDLTADEKDLQSTVNHLNEEALIADSLSVLMNNMNTTQPANLIYLYSRSLTRSIIFSVNDRTIVQLRNAGGMRLIRNKAVSDSMIAYYKEVDNLKFLFDESLTIKRLLREKYEPLLKSADFSEVIDSDNSVINPSNVLHLRSADPGIINTCLLEINNIKGLSKGTAKRIEKLKDKAISIKKYIGKEYHLE